MECYKPKNKGCQKNEKTGKNNHCENPVCVIKKITLNVFYQVVLLTKTVKLSVLCRKMLLRRVAITFVVNGRVAED